MAASVSKAEVLYLADPLCGWCYAMSPVVEKIQAAFADKITITVLTGGMLTGDKAGTLTKQAQDLLAALPEIEHIADVKFGEPFRNLAASGTYWYDSEIPCRALTVFRQLNTQNADRQLHFFRAIQIALFRDGLDLNDTATYELIAESFGLNGTEFGRLMALPETALATRREFSAVARTGIQDIPTVVLRVGEGTQGYVLTRGYQPFDKLAAIMEDALRQAAEEGATH
jgi:putative protein-disulfide isomerase